MRKVYSLLFLGRSSPRVILVKGDETVGTSEVWSVLKQHMFITVSNLFLFKIALHVFMYDANNTKHILLLNFCSTHFSFHTYMCVYLFMFIINVV
jgi:hypothetical protein